MSLSFLWLLASVAKHPNIRFTVEKEVDHKIPFLDVFIHNQSQGPTTTVFRKKIFTVLLANYFSFTASSYKIGRVRTLVDRTLNQQHGQAFTMRLRTSLLFCVKTAFPSTFNSEGT